MAARYATHRHVELEEFDDDKFDRILEDYADANIWQFLINELIFSSESIGDNQGDLEATATERDVAADRIPLLIDDLKQICCRESIDDSQLDLEAKNTEREVDADDISPLINEIKQSCFTKTKNDNQPDLKATYTEGDVSADDSSSLFDELKESYCKESKNETQRDLESTAVERDDLEAFQVALNKLNDSNADKNKSCASCSKEVRVENVSSFTRGQHISMPGKMSRIYNKYTHRLKHSYRHHAIIKTVIPKDDQRVEMEVIHFSREDNCIKICESLKTYDLKCDEIYIVEYAHPRYKADEIVLRAESMLPKNRVDQREFRNYNPGTSNCEHFATWCVVGKGESFQVQSLRQKIADKLKHVFGEGSKIAKILFRLLYVSSDEIAAGLTKAVNVPEYVLGGTTALYLVYCIVMTVLHIKKYRESQMCWLCLEGKLKDIWITFLLFGTTSVITFIFIHFALPLMAPVVGIPLSVVLILLSTALQWSVPKIRKALQTPFSVKETEIKEISDVNIGAVISLKYYMLEHNVIVTEVHEDGGDSRKGKIRGVHYGLSSLLGTREVMEENFTVDMTKSSVKLLDCSHLLTNAPDMVVQRARKRVGEKKWSMASNRSDHFCFWAKVRQRPRCIYENVDNGDLDASASKGLSSLFVEKKEVHLEEDLLKGDVITYKERGILTEKVIINDGNGRHLKIEMIVYDSKWYGRLKTYTLDLNTDHLYVDIYHPAHCHPMESRAKRAKQMQDKKGTWWTVQGFIKDCIMLNPL